MAPVELLYFANPMCSWCWGFAPVMRGIEAAYPGRVRITVALGALGDPDRPMRERDKGFVREHWEHVRALTGQPFDFGFFDRDGFVYDTGPACRAVAAVRAEAPGRALGYLHQLHEAFYARGRDIREPGVLADEAEATGLERCSFLGTLASPGLAAAVRKEWGQTAASGVTGYPTLLGLAPGHRPAVLSLGCRPLGAVSAEVGRFLAEANLGG
jgi:putative protein-disulfide isomerase